MITRSFIIRLSVALILVALAPCAASAQDWPSSLTKIIVPYLPGSAPDVLARILANKLGLRTHQTFIVENKPGANSIIGTTFVARGPADGKVVLFADRLAMSVNPLLYKSIPYDTRKDLASVTNVGETNMYLIVKSDFPATTFREFVTYAKANPGKIKFGSGGVGHISHLDMVAIQSGAGVQLLHIPYKGIAEVVPALVGGQVQATVSGIANFKPFLDQGKVRLLVIGAPQRSALSPDVPTITEAGGTDDMLLSTGYSVYTRAGTPGAIVRKMNEEIGATLAEPDIVTAAQLRGVDVASSMPEALERLMDHDEKILAKLVHDENIQVQ